jgi:hypothetical protein
MKFPRYLLTCTIMFSLTAVLVPSNSFAQPSQEKIVFQKHIATEGLLVVLEKEVPYIAPPEMKALSSNAHVGIPDHVYLYTFQLRRAHTTKIFWTPTRNHFAGNWFSSQPAMKVLDATISAKKLCVVYKQIAVNSAEVITPGTPLDKPDIAWADSKLMADNDAKEISIKSAAISGSLEKNDLSVELKNYDAKSFRFRLANNNWIQQNVFPMPVASASDASRKK